MTLKTGKKNRVNIAIEPSKYVRGEPSKNPAVKAILEERAAKRRLVESRAIASAWLMSLDCLLLFWGFDCE